VEGAVFAGYEPEGFFDEAFAASGEPRDHYRRLVRDIELLGHDEMARRARLRDASFRTKGITFTLSGDEDGLERTFPMDLLPRIIPADEWSVVEAGLAQRVRTLNKFLDDIYAGEQAAMRDGVIPRHVVTSSDGFAREAMGIHVPHAARCLIAGIDLVRDADGTYRVLEDNVRNPSGISYVLENRAATARILPRVLGTHAVRRVDDYGSILLAALRAIAPSGGTRPRIVVLTPGPYNSAYFEHVFAARQLGAELVEGRDLVVDDHVVYMRTTNGLERVDVIYRRVDDRYLDPVGFHWNTMIGVSGLLAAVRAGNVSIANAIGNGVADDKLVYAFVPDLIRYYLGEEPILANVPTYLLWNPDQRAEALDRLHELVVKPVSGAGGYDVIIGPRASEADLAEARRRIEADPRGWIAQEVVPLSRHPTLIDGRPVPRHIDLRPFVITRGDDIDVIPGGLTRVALREGSLIVNSSQGGGSKDTWVLVGDGGRSTGAERMEAE
jgi:uncharacterized circularly permuted ATP-grasp superfamily protein